MKSIVVVMEIAKKMESDFNDIFDSEEIRNINLREIPKMIDYFYEDILELKDIEALYFTMLESNLSENYGGSYRDIRARLKGEGVNID